MSPNKPTIKTLAVLKRGGWGEGGASVGLLPVPLHVLLPHFARVAVLGLYAAGGGGRVFHLQQRAAALRRLESCRKSHLHILPTRIRILII